MKTKITFFTIGVYGATEDEYFKKLVDANIDLFCDIRQRRGVRGKKYSFVNSIKLQNRLKELKINYLHIKDLAPTIEIREAQKQDDIQNNILKRNRTELGNIFIKQYKQDIIDKFDFSQLIKYLETNGFRNVVFFCVEEKQLACHRSIVSEEIYKYSNKQIKDL